MDKDKHCPPVHHFDESTKNKFREKGYSPPAQQRAWLVFFELKLDCTWLRKALTNDYGPKRGVGGYSIVNKAFL